MLSDINPIRARFAISEREYLTLARDQKYDRRDGAGKEGPALTLILADGSEHPEQGKVMGSAQSIDLETGTYSVEATFPNPDRYILPGQFARVRAPIETLKDVLVVPRQSVVEMQGMFRAYVVNGNNTIEVHEITLGPVSGNFVVVESGLEAGDSLVVEGLQKVRPGMQVRPQPFVPTKPANAD
jgi:membrane fusion protein (multidrug efflux system)